MIKPCPTSSFTLPPIKAWTRSRGYISSFQPSLSFPSRSVMRIDETLCDDALLLTTTASVILGLCDAALLFVSALVCGGWDPEAGLAALVLAGQIDTLAIATNLVCAALRKRAGAGGEA